eukprot:CAMPEP_0206041784 /NCGR_PEP_ID=MMETSP1466-20131121/6168_1 /ASSEMBLY_ACC=CAM_ASM_001126 /TAXON_ID=44452 /ORGANISM="Pavlova gyrans, Strain CCMP608" /LENGTH=30 /DNA_ID= /DNA_START= /DNA_END= /DNA_ORIENTATION=
MKVAAKRRRAAAASCRIKPGAPGHGRAEGG